MYPSMTNITSGTIRQSIQLISRHAATVLPKSTFLHLVLAVILLCFPIVMLGDLPFQSITAAIAANVLGLFFPLEQIGTVLMIGDLEVAITKDCSGLDTASALIPCALLWCLVSKKNLLVTVALIYPVLLIANTLRVIAITLLAYFSGVELAMGLLHDLTGLAVFAIAFLTIGAVQSEKMSVWFTRLKLKRLSTVFVLAMSTIYLLVDILQTYINSPLDRTSLPLFAFGLLFAVLAKPSFHHQPLKVDQNMMLVFGLIFVGVYLDFRIILNTGILLIIFFGLNQIAQTRIWVSASIACLLAALPGLPFAVSTLTDNWHPIVIQCLLAAVLTPILAFIDSLSKQAFVSNIVRPLSITCMCLVTLLLVNSLFTHKAASADVIDIPYLFNGWVGKDIPLTLNEERLFQHGSVVKREYQRGDNTVWLLHLQTSDRRSIHPPQYCYSSDGWKIDNLASTDSQYLKGKFGDFSATKPNQLRRVKYWYDFSGEVFSESSAFIRYKTQLMLTGGTESWQLYRISSDSIDDDHQQRAFISDLNAIVAK